MQGEPFTGPNFKAPKGSALLERKSRRAELVAHEQKELQAALKRDHRKCRFPGCSGKHRGQTLPIDPCHMKRPDGTWHRGPGGDATGIRTDRRWALALCRAHHGLYDAHEIQIDALDHELGADGLLMFSVKHPETGAFVHIATEKRVGVSETRT